MDFKIAYQRLQEINLYIKSEQIIDIQELISLQKEAEQLFNYLQAQLRKQNNE